VEVLRRRSRGNGEEVDADRCLRECEALYSEANVRTLKTLKPGQAGTKALLALYGRGLLCVRYRYDEATG